MTVTAKASNTSIASADAGAASALAAQDAAVRERCDAALAILDRYNASDDDELPECAPEDRWRLYRDLIALLTA